MKKYLSLAIGILLPLLTIAPINVNADTARDNFGTALTRTFNGSFTSASNANFSVLVNGRNVLLGKTVADGVRYGTDLEAHKDITASFDSGAINEIVADVPLIAGDFTIGFDVFYEDSEAYLWTKIKNMGLSLDAQYDNDPVKQLSEGYFELFKFLQNQYITLDIEAIIGMFSGGGSPELEMIADQFRTILTQLKEPGTTYNQIIGVALDAGVLQLNRNGAIYILTLPTESGEIDVAKLAGIFDILGYPTELSEEMRQLLSDNETEIQEAWKMLSPMLDIEVRFHSAQQNEIRFIATDIRFELDKSALPVEIAAEVPSVVISLDGVASVSPNAGRISFPTKIGGIDLTKFYGALRATFEMMDFSTLDTAFDEEVEFEDFETVEG